MGADVVEQAIPSFERQWDREFLRFKQEGLFSQEPELANRRFPARPIGSPRLEKGGEYSGRLDGTSLNILHGGEVVASVDHVPIEVQNRIRNQNCGMAWVRAEESPLPISGFTDVTVH